MAEKIEPATKVSKALLDNLNDAIAREMQVVIQYMWQHVQWSGSGVLPCMMNCNPSPSRK